MGRPNLIPFKWRLYRVNTVGVVRTRTRWEKMNKKKGAVKRPLIQLELGSPFRPILASGGLARRLRHRRPSLLCRSIDLLGKLRKLLICLFFLVQCFFQQGNVLGLAE